ncbi:MAG: VPLPA-CTERM-specific exosortase XrtD, partial [Pontibacterium sp.]
HLIGVWLGSPEYGHGLLIPFVVSYIIWDARDRVFANSFEPSWLGVLLCFASMSLFWFATLADLEAVKAYALVITLAALVLTFGGMSLLKQLAFPILLLLCAVPLPYLINKLLTLKMQLISSDLGVAMIRLMGMPVLQEGNVINMGSFKMLVAEACSGLRYMFSLISIGFVVAYFFKAPTWARILVVLSSIPITIVMNSLRIAATGWIIKEFGQAAAEGFMHAFEGWVVFVAALALQLGFIWILTKFIPGKQSFVSYFYLASGEKPTNFALWPRLPAPVIGFFVVVIGLGLLTLSARFSYEPYIPEREPFQQIPFVIDGRGLVTDTFEQEVLDVLKADDVFLGDYRHPSKLDVNVYMAYYESQRDGAVVHSPKDCLPSGGWEIENIQATPLPNLPGEGNRAVISKGDDRLLVYYWVAQQGINYANEHKARAMLLKESVLNNRTDAGLVRIIVPVKNSLEASESVAKEFIASMAQHLPKYLPN